MQLWSCLCLGKELCYFNKTFNSRNKCINPVMHNVTKYACKRGVLRIKKMLSWLLKVTVACNWIITDAGVSVQPSNSLFIHSYSLWSCRNQMCLQSHSLICFSHFLNGYTSFRSWKWEIEFFGVRVCGSLYLHTEFPKVLLHFTWPNTSTDNYAVLLWLL